MITLFKFQKEKEIGLVIFNVHISVLSVPCLLIGAICFTEFYILCLTGEKQIKTMRLKSLDHWEIFEVSQTKW